VAIAAGLGNAPSWALQVGSGIVDNTVFVDPEFGSDSASCGGDDLWGNGSPVQGNYQSTGPCQSLNQALANLPSSGGNVIITRPGVFGPIILTAGVSITGPEPSAIIDWRTDTVPGCLTGVSCNGGGGATYAVDIQAPGATVKFKNLIINANGGATAAVHVGSATGVSFTATSLRCGSGSSVPEMLLVDSSQGSQLQLYVHNSDFAFCQGGGGVVLSPTGATPIRMDFNNSEVHNAVFGLQANASELTGSGNNILIIVESTQFFSFNNSAISVTAPSASNQGNFLVTRSDIGNTGGAGIKLNGAGAQSAIYEAAILGNPTGINLVNGASMATYQNNVLIGNNNNCEVSNVPTPCSSALSPQPLD